MLLIGFQISKGAEGITVGSQFILGQMPRLTHMPRLRPKELAMPEFYNQFNFIGNLNLISKLSILLFFSGFVSQMKTKHY